MSTGLLQLFGTSNSSIFTNFTGSNLAAWQTGYSAVHAGTRNAQILCIGDSITMGTGSNNDLHTNALDNGYPAQLGKGILNLSNWQSMMANNGLGPINEIPGVDSRLGIAGGWILVDQCFQGSLFGSQSAGVFSFTPAQSVDTFKVYYPSLFASGRFTISLDGGSVLQTINTDSGGANTIGVATQTVGLGTHALDLEWDSGGSGGFCYLLQITAYDSSFKQFLILNAGLQGATAAQWISSSGTPWYSQDRLASIAADITLILAGTNDWIQGTNLTTYTNALQTIINITTGAGSSVILMSDPPTLSSVTPNVTQATYVAATKALAISNNIPFIDMWRLFGSDWSVANSRGWIFDAEHPNGLGYTQIANAVNMALQPGFTSP
jgi:lysophospholipase L1-like esterase